MHPAHGPLSWISSTGVAGRWEGGRLLQEGRLRPRRLHGTSVDLRRARTRLTLPDQPLQRTNASATRSKVNRGRDGAGCARTSSRPCYARGDRSAFAAERQIVRQTANPSGRSAAGFCSVARSTIRLVLLWVVRAEEVPAALGFHDGEDARLLPGVTCGLLAAKVPFEVRG